MLQVWLLTLYCHLHYLGIWLATGDGHTFIGLSNKGAAAWFFFLESCQLPWIHQCLKSELLVCIVFSVNTANFIMHKCCFLLQMFSPEWFLLWILICLTDSCYCKNINKSKKHQWISTYAWCHQMILQWVFRACRALHLAEVTGCVTLTAQFSSAVYTLPAVPCSHGMLAHCFRYSANLTLTLFLHIFPRLNVVNALFTNSNIWILFDESFYKNELFRELMQIYSTHLKVMIQKSK